MPGVQHHRRRRVDPERRADRRAAAGHRHITRTGRVFDEHDARVGHNLARRHLEMRADDDGHARSLDGGALEQLKHPAQHRRSAEREVLELLRQARVHVVEMGNAERGRDHDADRRAFFVRVHGVVLTFARAVQRRQRQRHVQKQLGRRRADLHARDERRPGRAKDAQARQRDILAEWIGDEVDRVAEIEKRADAVILAERGAPRLEERLGRDHQYPHQFI